MQHLEPYYGWLKYYSNEEDPHSPFFESPHSELFFDRQVYQYLAHPQWENFGSEGLLLKILFADYEKAFVVIELFGVWNDLLLNDFRMLKEEVLEPLVIAGIRNFIFVSENVLNVYLDSEDYYEDFWQEIEDGWMCLLNARPHVLEQMEDYGIDTYFYWATELEELQWRKLKPFQLFQLIQAGMRLLP